MRRPIAKGLSCFWSLLSVAWFVRIFVAWHHGYGAAGEIGCTLACWAMSLIHAKEARDA